MSTDRAELIADLTTQILGRTAPKAAQSVVDRLERLGWRGPDDEQSVADQLDRLRQERDAFAEILEQLLAPSMWSEQFYVQPVPWKERVVHVARGVIEVEQLNAFTKTYLEAGNITRSEQSAE